MRIATKYPRIAARLLRAHRAPGRDRRGQGLGRARAADRARRGDRRPHRDRHDAARERARRPRGDRRRDGAADRQPGRAQAQGGGDRRRAGAAAWALSASRPASTPRPPPTAVRALAPGAASVAGAVREIVDDVRERRRRRAAALRRALRPRRRRAARGGRDARGGARRPRPAPCAPGSRSRSRTSAPWPRPGSAPTSRSRSRRARPSRCARSRSAAPRSTSPAAARRTRRTVVMGVVTARAAGRRRGRRLRAGRAPGDPRRVRAVRRRRRLLAWAAPTRSPRSPTGPRRSPRVDVIVGPGNLYVQEAKRQVSAATSGSTASPARRDVRRARRRRAPTRRSSRSTSPPRPSTATGTVVVRRVATTPALLDALEIDPGDAVAALVDAPDLETALAFAEALRPRAPASSSAPRPRRSRRACARAGCLFVGADERDRVRRLRRGLEPHAARPTAPRASPPASSAAPLPPAHERGADRRRPPARSRAPAAPIARAEGFERHAASMEVRENRGAVSAHARSITRKTGETDVALAPRPRRHRRGHAARPASASSTTCSTCSPATAGSTSTSTVTRRPADRRAPHGRGHRDRARAGARPRARRPRRDHPLRPRGRPDGRGARRVRDRHLRPAVPAPSTRASLPPGDIGGFDHELTEEFFRAVASSARLTLHLDVAGRHERPPHDRGGVQGVRPRAARRGRDRPDRDRRAVDQGDADA